MSSCSENDSEDDPITANSSDSDFLNVEDDIERMYAENYPSPQDIFTTVEFFEGDNSDIENHCLAIYEEHFIDTQEDLMDFTYEEVTITYDHDFSRPTRIERTTISSATYENTNCRYSNNSYAIEDSEEIMEIEYSSSESDE